MIFENVCLQLSPNYRDGYFNNEINHLSSILNLLLEINSNIDKRKNIISSLKQINNVEFEGNENINELIQKAISLLNDYSEWGTCNFNYYRGDVCTFLHCAADFWLSVFHVDGIRMNAKEVLEFYLIEIVIKEDYKECIEELKT